MSKDYIKGIASKYDLGYHRAVRCFASVGRLSTDKNSPVIGMGEGNHHVCDASVHTHWSGDGTEGYIAIAARDLEKLIEAEKMISSATGFDLESLRVIKDRVI
ncbi:MAG TPA: hypothetical protein VJH65_03585 [Candidatus Nanoarchaeia archaeon]|nr:hypothetical protein [Candidatus Pacearchaeota archaeon]HLC87328.1 hypothetical protein [Candidatus Nanoarchaeia archaeon]